jgi:putative transposase
MRSTDERKKMVESNHEALSVNKQLDLVSISSSSFYYVPKGESEENRAILRLLDEQYFKTPFYGVLRLTALLVGLGYKVNRKRVRRLMQILDWKTIYREPKTTIGNKQHKKYPYLLGGLKINRCNQVWATDITYIPMKTGYMYLMAVVDLHSRYVLHWSLSNSMTAEWCAEVLQETLYQYGKPEIFNTDQGSQFTSDVFIKALTDNEIKISMDGKGRALDNIFVERLWRSVKYEHIYLNVYEDGLSLWKGLDGYFRFYNQERPHQSLAYKTPANCYYANAA